MKPQKISNNNAIPFFGSPVFAGFPGHAEDFVESNLDLNKKLIKHPVATFFVRVKGDSMIDKDIKDGDILIVDKSLEPFNGAVIIAIIDGEFTVKTFIKKGEKVTLYPANEKYKPIEISEINDFRVWGIVTSAIHQYI